MTLKNANPDQVALIEHLVAIYGRLHDDYDCSIRGEGWSMSLTLRDRSSGQLVWECYAEPRIIAERFAEWIAHRNQATS